ncbi:MAG: cold-shock protein [Chloroflexota bacterium]
MDEYRPYPTDQPKDDTDEAEENEVTQPVTRADRPEPGPAASPEEDDDEDDGGDESDAGEPSRRSERGERGERGERAERAEPNLDHPGGHLTGTLARLNRPRRFGFLKTDDGMEIFFHASALESGPSSFDQLRSGQAVEFDCHQDEGGRGLAATLVQVVGPPPAEAARPPRAPREEGRGSRGRGERGERSERGERGTRENWRVEVLQDRADGSVRAQLERLLNERGVKPGNFSIAIHEGQGGAECWVAYYTGDDGGRR